MPASTYPGVPVPYNGSGRRYGDVEKALLAEVIDSGALTRWGGVMADRLEQEWCARSGSTHAIATSSGTTALHTALAALEITPGRNVVTSPVTDMGSIISIIQNGLIPVFADVDPMTGMMTADTIEAVWTDDCGAVMFVHLFGRCADLRDIRSLTNRKDAWLVEDTSQVHFGSRDGFVAGRVADIAATSLQQSKVVSCGEGGIVTTDCTDLADRARLFQNKGWHRGQSGSRAYPTLGHNFRMPELSAAVALGQLRQVDDIITDRAHAYGRLCQDLGRLSGWQIPKIDPGETPSWWTFMIRHDTPNKCDLDSLAAELNRIGLPFAHGYIGTDPIFMTQMLRERRGMGGTTFPWDLLPDKPQPDIADYPGAISFQTSVLTMPLCETLSKQDTDFIAKGFLSAAQSQVLT